MGDPKATESGMAPEVNEDDQNSTELMEKSKELCKTYEVKDDDKCRDHVVPRDLTDKLFKEPAKAKLRFGIEAILNVSGRVDNTKKEVNSENIRYNEQFDKTDKHEIDDEKMNTLERRLSNSYMESLLSKDNGDDDDDDNEDDDDEIDSEAKDYKNLKFDIDVARARLAYMGYTASFSSPGLTDQGGLPLQPNSILPPFPVSNATYPWAAVSDIRKERFSMVRRIGHPYQNRTPPKRKKPRTSFTRLQILELEKRFERQKYLASTERSALAKTLKMTDAQVKTWFQNRRTKWRRQTAEEREIERQAANRLLLSLQSDPAHRKSMVMSPDSVCLSHLQRWQEKRSVDI